MPLLAADEDDSPFDIVDGVQYGYNQSMLKIVGRSEYDAPQTRCHQMDKLP